MKTTRRQFLSTAARSSALISLSPLVPQILLQATAAAADSPGERVLVVVQLTGGNDGLNTVVPYGDDAYRRNRFTLAIGADQVLKIDRYAGLHPSMRGFAKLLEDGKLAIVQGVGYPNPNRSHFESMDLWHTAHQAAVNRPNGWLGRYLDAAAKRDGRDVPAMHLGAEKQPLALVGQDIQVPSVQSIENFRLEVGGNNELRRVVQASVAAERPANNDLLTFVQNSTTAALTSSERVEHALGNYRTSVNYPGTGLAQKLRTVAQLIDAGMSTRIYYLTLDGFDTHSNQGATHANLLAELSDATAAFLDDLSQHNHAQRVLLMTFSEFGRRVKENASQGTDHGAAAPMFLAGNTVTSGLHGKHPSLTDLQEGDLKHHTDYRQVYATVLQNWLGWKGEAILGGSFQPLPIISA
jgi:uncharacterized protein (DUF1501 family)